ncbi:beta-ketoacyl synthase chain length factor [Litchfieldella rifensis]|uniref:Beta-ketoacyl synthase chain length factor n=1 Tax=Litchfieldella rifensis TaxID=762643 RepID=A0ABV7LR85_9GAMM
MRAALHLEDWRAWSANSMSCAGDSRHDISACPNPGKLPALLRRRLDSAGRATCEILGALDPEANCPLVHASRHGDATHTLEMLAALTRGDPVSPTRFSMSVHNAVLGVHSIATRHYLPMQALGACGHEFEALLYEAQGYLMEGHSAVVVVFSEGSLPPAYHGHAESPDGPCAVGLRLTAGPGTALMASDTPRPAHPTPLDVVAWLNSAVPHLDGQRRWQLEAG